VKPHFPDSHTVLFCFSTSIFIPLNLYSCCNRVSCSAHIYFLLRT